MNTETMNEPYRATITGPGLHLAVELNSKANRKILETLLWEIRFADLSEPEPVSEPTGTDNVPGTMYSEDEIDEMSAGWVGDLAGRNDGDLVEMRAQ